MSRDTMVMFHVVQNQGKREYQEDRYLIIENFYMGYSLFAVFDGHGGAYVAEFCKANMAAFLKAEMVRRAAMDMRSAIITAFHRLHAALDTPKCYMTGTTCTLVLLHRRHMWVANCGDSRAITGSSSTFTALTRDHKPNATTEEERINSLGGYVASVAGIPRVIGELAVSRSIGDLRYAPYVIPTPEVVYFPLGADHRYVVLATDGMWDVLSNHEVATHVVQHLEPYNRPPTRTQLVESVDALIQEMLKKENIEDNVTIINVFL
jgi:protein phosphatase 2C